MKLLKSIIIGLAVIGALVLGVTIDYKIWRAEHPNAQTWTYFLSEH